MIYLSLFYEFFKTGLFVFGGGMAAIPFLQEISEKTGWYTTRQLMDMIAVSESTPGPIGVNMATYAGYMTAGFSGGLAATLGLIAPSLIITVIVARLLYRFKESSLAGYAFYGLRPASLGLIAAAGISILRLSLLNTELLAETGDFIKLFDFKAILIAALLFFLTNKIKTHPITFIAGSAAVGIVFGL